MDAFWSRLKRQGPDPVYYLTGSEEVLKDEAIENLVEASLGEGLRDFNFDQIQASRADPASLNDLCSTLPMMADRRVVVVRGVEAWKRKTRSKKAALNYLADPAPETVLVLVQSSGDDKLDKDLSAAASTVQFGEMEPHRITRWLTREASRQGIEFGDGALDHLRAAVGTNLGLLRAEMAKLASLETSGPITVEQVGDLVGVRRGETLDDWCHLVMAGQSREAMCLVEPLLQQAGTTPVRVLMALGRTLVGVGIARGHYDSGNRGRSLENAIFQSIRRARPFGLGSWKAEAGLWASWAPAWPPPRIRKGLDDMATTDQLLKDTRLSSDVGVLTDLVGKLALGREVAA